MIKPFFCSHLAVALEPFGAVATLAILIVRATVAVVELQGWCKKVKFDTEISLFHGP